MNGFQFFVTITMMALLALALAFARTEIHDLHNSVNALSATVNGMRR